MPFLIQLYFLFLLNRNFETERIKIIARVAIVLSRLKTAKILVDGQQYDNDKHILITKID